MTTQELMKIIVADPYANVTFSGGDPMYQCDGFAELARAIHAQTNKDIWCYTGYKWENIVDNPRFRPLLETIDVLVDSPFILAQRDTSLRFRGSGNQRIIDVKQSLAKGEIVIMDY